MFSFHSRSTMHKQKKWEMSFIYMILLVTHGFKYSVLHIVYTQAFYFEFSL